MNVLSGGFETIEQSYYPHGNLQMWFDGTMATNEFDEIKISRRYY